MYLDRDGQVRTVSERRRDRGRTKTDTVNARPRFRFGRAILGSDNTYGGCFSAF